MIGVELKQMVVAHCVLSCSKQRIALIIVCSRNMKRKRDILGCGASSLFVLYLQRKYELQELDQCIFINEHLSPENRQLLKIF